MRVWLCLLGLGLSCQCFDFNYPEVDSVIDLRTKYRKYLPEILKDITDPPDDASQSFNLTAFQIKKNKTGHIHTGFSNSEEYIEDPDMSESKRKWMKEMNPRVKGYFSWEYNSSEYRKYEKSLEKRLQREENTTDVFENDIDDLWDLYLANKTVPPNFNLAFSPRFMFQAYREYSLSFHNITVSTTNHWLDGPLTGEDGIKYDQAMERLRKFEINKNDPEKVAAIDRFIENDMKGKKLNKTKDIVRYFIGFRNRLGVTLNYTQSTISISEELKKMNVPDTEEILKKLEKEQSVSDEGEPPDIEKLLNVKTKEEFSDEEQSTEKTTKPSLRKQQETSRRSKPPPLTMFSYIFNTYPRAKVVTTVNSQEMFEQDGPAPTQARAETGKTNEPQPTGTKKHEPSTTTQKPQPSTTHTTEPVRPDKPNETVKHEETPDPQPFHHSPSEIPPLSSSTPRLVTRPSFEEKYRNHTAVKFLHKHKNKFLLGGMACLVAAKIFG